MIIYKSSSFVSQPLKQEQQQNEYWLISAKKSVASYKNLGLNKIWYAEKDYIKLAKTEVSGGDFELFFQVTGCGL